MMEETNYKVYCHTLKNDGRRYFGITKQNIDRRWRDGKGYKNSFFALAIKKYGWEAFEHEIIKSNINKNEALKLEIELIAKYKTQDKKFGFNLTAGGDGGLSPTEEVKEKMRKAKLGTHHESRPISEETKKKISEANKGKVRTADFKQKIREINKNSPYSFINKQRKIKCIETNKIFNSITDASKYYGANHRNFKRAIDNNNKWAGYHWQYI